MSDDLVSRLRSRYVEQTTSLGDFGTHTIGTPDVLCQEAAQALTEARAEIERLRRDKSAGFAFWRSIAKRFCNARKAALDRAAAAESELSTLRARVREVVGPFGKIDPFETAFSKHGKIFRLDYNASVLDQLTFEHFRAARQLMEDLK